MTEGRVLGVARAFDAHAYLRPGRVGGDPARIKVDPSMEAVLAAQGLPIEWLTVRRNERDGAFEGGEIELLPGRGSWIGEYNANGDLHFSLIGHKIEQTWLADTLEAKPDAVEDAASLFEELVVAADAAWGCVLPWAWWPFPLNTTIDAALPGIFWLNYFGPAFVARYPSLTDIPGARTLDTGGVLVRTADEPWQPYEKGIPSWQAELRALFGEQAFKWKRPNPALPTAEDHVAASPGDMEMPWVGWLAEKAAADRGKKHSAALKRLAKATDARTEPTLPEDAVEWSTSLDLDEWREFSEYLTRKLRGDLATAVGKAAIAVITTAPLDEEDNLRLNTNHGVVQIGWFIDDESTVDIYVWGSPAVHDLCNEWLT